MNCVKRSVLGALLAAGLLCAGAAWGQTSWHAQHPVQDQGMTNPHQHATWDKDQAVTLVDPGKIYNAKDPSSWVGKPVVLKNVTVQDTNDTGNFWVGSDDDHRLLVVKQVDNPNLGAMKVKKGDVVTIEGVIHPASEYMAHGTTASGGSMNDARDSSGVFLLANELSVTSSTRH